MNYGNLRNDLDRELVRIVHGGPTKQELVRFMKLKWEVQDRDFFGVRIEGNDCFSYHHTRVAACNGGPITVYNGSLLSGKVTHPLTHIVGDYNKDMFRDLTKILIAINDQRHFPTPEQINRAYEIFCAFERENCGRVNNKGYSRVRECYHRRLIR